MDCLLPSAPLSSPSLLPSFLPSLPLIVNLGTFLCISIVKDLEVKLLSRGVVCFVFFNSSIWSRIVWGWVVKVQTVASGGLSLHPAVPLSSWISYLQIRVYRFPSPRMGVKLVHLIYAPTPWGRASFTVEKTEAQRGQATLSRSASQQAWSQGLDRDCQPVTLVLWLMR